MDFLPRTEEEVELAVERKTDRLDARFLRGEIDAEEYNRLHGQLSEWALDQYRRLGVTS